MHTVQVCLSPELIHLFSLEGKIVVVTDILRATSCMTTGIAEGLQHIKPVAGLNECAALKNEGYITAAERNGRKVEGFDMGNSPYSYMDKHLKGKKVATTTTNGTLAITKSVTAEQVIIGSFLNLTAVSNYLTAQQKDVIIHCAGWKGNFSLEDSLYAGALIEQMAAKVSPGDDAAFSTLTLYQSAKNNLLETVLGSAHAKRLANHNITKDIEFCCTIDRYDSIPVLKNGVLVPLGQ